MKDETIGCGCLGYLFIIVALLIEVAFFYFGWNLVIVVIFGLKQITLFQSVLLMFFINIIGSAFRSVNRKN